MENFIAGDTNLRFLVCYDVDLQSASRLAEVLVKETPTIDAILLAGPFAHAEMETKEERAVVESDIASAIAQFENIVCRVIYLPADGDPSEVLTELLRLTPNSLNIHGRELNLTRHLRILGFAEKKDYLSQYEKAPRNMDLSPDSDDELDIVRVDAATHSANIIEEMLLNSAKIEEEVENQVEENSSANLKLSADESKSVGSGIFMLNYRFSHTLNKFLFHMTKDLEAAGISLCIVTSPDCAETQRLPKKFGKLGIAAPKSLRLGGHYTVVDMKYDAAAGVWDPHRIETYTL
jgi:hypothetical protein